VAVDDQHVQTPLVVLGGHDETSVLLEDLLNGVHERNLLLSVKIRGKKINELSKKIKRPARG
jgi:hypothetical protein